MKRVALVSPYTLPFYCGNSFLAERLKQGFGRRGFDVSLFSSSQDSPDEVISCAPDILHSLNAERPYDWLARVWERYTGPWIITLTGTDYNSWCGVTDPPARIKEALEAADRLVVFHDEALETLRKCLPSIFHKINVIPQGVAPYAGLSERTELRIREGFGKEDICFLMVASVRPVKNISSAIGAFRELRKEVPSARLLLIGPALDDEEAERVLSLGGRTAGFAYLGEKTPREVRAYMKAADIFLNVSLNEGMPGAVLEAMTEGLPVLASDVTGNRALITHEENGLLFTSGNKEALVRNAARLARDRTLREELGRRGQKSVMARHSIDHELDGYESLYEDLLRQRKPRSRTFREAAVTG
ncbi:MAG: glycosyl transferase family 1 [Deltaproteobacteria bacterium]|jgi:glycosyltransferase involved in cell wall biosynthesis|nr:glycosyl transferase family 1 [Deltaproteobacteria bacterium]